MAVYSVFQHPESVRYRTSICTAATFFVIVCFALTFLTPFFLVYQSQGFWKKENRFREQLTVEYKHELMAVFDIVDNTAAGSGKTSFVAWSTYPTLNSLQQSHLRVPAVKSHEIDQNLDGLPDRLELSLDLPLMAGEEVHGVKMILLFQCKLKRKSVVTFQSLAYLQHESFLPGSKYDAYGDLRLAQRVPIFHTGRNDLTYNTPLFDSSSGSIDTFDFGTILKNYRRRNLTTSFESEYSQWTTGRPQGNPFKVQVSMSFPEEEVIYYTGFWELLKYAWVQYVAVLLVFVVLFNRIKVFVFSHQIFPTAVVSTCKKYT